MSPRRFVACGALLGALAHAHVSPEAAVAAVALSEVATDVIKAFKAEQLNCAAETPLALTTSVQLEAAMLKIRAKVAGNDGLMGSLACSIGEAGEADEADAVVCGLARAVHSFVRRSTVEGASRSDERPFVLAALHRWNAVGFVAGPPWNLVPGVAARDVRGLALLLGRPVQHAVDGAAAFAFRALQAVSAGGGQAVDGSKEGTRQVGRSSRGRSSRMQLPTAGAPGALAAAATHCRLLLFGASATKHDAARAAASAMELAICRFTVATHDAFRRMKRLKMFRLKSSQFEAVEAAMRAAHDEAVALLRGAADGNVFVQVGPVLPQQIEAEEENAGPTVAAVDRLLAATESAYASSTQLGRPQKKKIEKQVEQEESKVEKEDALAQLERKERGGLEQQVQERPGPQKQSEPAEELRRLGSRRKRVWVEKAAEGLGEGERSKQKKGAEKEKETNDEQEHRLEGTQMWRPWSDDKDAEREQPAVDSFGPQPTNQTQPRGQNGAARMGLTSGGLTSLVTNVERSEAFQSEGLSVPFRVGRFHSEVEEEETKVDKETNDALGAEKEKETNDEQERRLEGTREFRPWIND